MSFRGPPDCYVGMSDYHGGDVEEMEDEYDMNEPVDDMDEEEEEEEDEEEYQEPMVRDSDVEEEDEDQSVPDTSAADARNGKDIQGIPWERMTITRETYRQARLEQYKNYENIPNSGEAAMKVEPINQLTFHGKEISHWELFWCQQACKSTEKDGAYYEFRRNTRSVKSTISHFQLRNLVWATSKHDVYLLLHYSVRHWSALRGVDTEIMDVDGHVAPSEVGNIFLFVLSFESLASIFMLFHCLIAEAPRKLVRSGALHFIASNNDCGVREYDMERYQQYKHFRFDWPVNYICLFIMTQHTSLSPDGKLVIIVGDDTDALLIDANSGKQTIHSMKGHLDYSFASAWSPDGRTFATGNQDKTCRIWDARNLSQSVHVLRGNVGAIRSVRFTSDGQFLSMAEAADFVHIFDIKSDYNKRQELDFFGDVSGMSFSPDTDTLYVGVSDRIYGSLLQFGRRYSYTYLDSLL
ncbi:hypothetical protein HU200_025156 [Digitaria exilis]|uniref:Uncharacterized protein n=1 Tax=Digitaria exilis TaxID=1010633 RepID=A0A835EVM7_9POAL|nr:hypothetical protein HU200_025156 [Digitaria exilis]